MAFKILAGPLLNAVTRAAVEPAMTPAPLSHWPASGLRDGRASSPAFFGSVANDATIDVDLNEIPGGDFETAGDETHWTVLGTGALSREAGAAKDGSFGLRLTPVTSYALAVLDVVVRAGEELHFKGSVKGTVSKLYIRNRQTGKFLQSGGTWAAPSVDDGDITNAGTPLASSTGSWASADLAFTVENLATCQRDTVTLRVYLYTSSGALDADSIFLWPKVNWCSVHGHNVSPFVTPTLQSSSDGAAWTTRETMTLRPDSFYVAASSLYDYRYWRLLLDGYPDSSELTYLGEWVLGQAYSPARKPSYGGAITFLERQNRLGTAGGDEWVYQYGARPQRSLSLAFGFRNDAEYVEFRDVFFRGSRGGANHLVIAPIDLDDSVVILGRIRESVTVAKTARFPRATEVEIVESPLPNVPDPTHAYDKPVTEGGTTGTVVVLVRLQSLAPYTGGDATVDLATDLGAPIDSGTAAVSGYITFTGVTPGDVQVNATAPGKTFNGSYPGPRTGTVVAGETLYLYCEEDFS